MRKFVEIPGGKLKRINNRLGGYGCRGGDARPQVDAVQTDSGDEGVDNRTLRVQPRPDAHLVRRQSRQELRVLTVGGYFGEAD